MLSNYFLITFILCALLQYWSGKIFVKFHAYVFFFVGELLLKNTFKGIEEGGYEKRPRIVFWRCTRLENLLNGLHFQVSYETQCNPSFVETLSHLKLVEQRGLKWPNINWWVCKSSTTVKSFKSFYETQCNQIVNS